MDLVAGTKHDVVITDHVAKDGAAKLVEHCTLPLTGLKGVDRIITDRAVLDVTDNGLVLRQLAPGETVEGLREITGALSGSAQGRCVSHRCTAHSDPPGNLVRCDCAPSSTYPLGASPEETHSDHLRPRRTHRPRRLAKIGSGSKKPVEVASNLQSERTRIDPGPQQTATVEPEARVTRRAPDGP